MFRVSATRDAAMLRVIAADSPMLRCYAMILPMLSPPAIRRLIIPAIVFMF